MVEEIKPEAKKEEKTEVKAEVPAKEPDRIELANLAADRIEKANTDFKKLLDRQEKMETERILAGHATSGEKQKPIIETPKEYAEKVMRGEVGK